MIFSFIMHFGFSQTVEMPSMPSMPDFPSVSQDGSFYRPSFPSKINKQKNLSKNSEDSQNQNETVIKNQSVDIAKTLLELILCEEIRKCNSELSIHSRDNVLTMKKLNQTDIPEIYQIFNKILAEVQIDFSYTADSVSLRFKA